uniref:SPRY domain-containing protein n=1 Tax=Davidia involucrata TaxID=16924 RepID=A0A5B7A3T6_DAVIN
MASMKREPPQADTVQPEAKKAKVAEGESSEPLKAKQCVLLNPADSDLDFNIEGIGLQGSALHEQGFAYCWSGARANVGITGGKYCFGCKIISAQLVEMENTPLDQQHVCRLGISRGDDAVGNLGETEHSFGFGGTGKFSNARKFSDYGEKFGVGDTIVCAVNLENKPLAFIGFSKNGKWLGTAKHFNAGSNGLRVVDSPVNKLQWESALFPHVLLKNVIVQMQFSIEDELIPEEGYKPWASALDDGNAIMGPTFSNPRDCEVMMLVGLPASGKTTWAEKWVKEHPDKRYVLLGTNLALDQMKVPGLLRKNNYGERFDCLMDRATGIFNTLLARASKTPRNYIIDQTNVYKSARKRKLKPFANFHKIAVVVFPKPDELKLRAGKRFKEMGKEVPAEAVNEMLANYVLPTSKEMPGADEYFDQVMFPELNRGESQRYLDEMKRDLGSVTNVSLKSNLSPYSRESSIQSYYSPSMQNQGTLAVTGGHWQSSHPPQPLPNYAYRSPGQVNSAYLDAGQPGRTESFSAAYQDDQNPPAPRDAPYGNYSSTGGSLHRDDFSHYGSDGWYDQPRRNDIESRIANPGGVADPYRTYGLGDPYSRSGVESRNFILGGAADPYQSGSSTYSTHGGYTSVSGGPQADLQAPRQPTFLPCPPTSYGSPYGTPVPRPSYGNFPADMQRSGGYVPPRPRYF